MKISPIEDINLQFGVLCFESVLLQNFVVFLMERSEICVTNNVARHIGWKNYKHVVFDRSAFIPPERRLFGILTLDYPIQLFHLWWHSYCYSYSFSYTSSTC